MHYWYESPEHIRGMKSGTARDVAQFILDNTVAVGMGTCYDDEIEDQRRVHSDLWRDGEFMSTEMVFRYFVWTDGGTGFPDLVEPLDEAVMSEHPTAEQTELLHFVLRFMWLSGFERDNYHYEPWFGGDSTSPADSGTMGVRLGWGLASVLRMEFMELVPKPEV